MAQHISLWNLALPAAWLFTGCLALIPWDGLGGQILAYGPLTLPAILLAAAGFPQGSLWSSGHSPPLLNSSGVLVVYFLPAAIGLIWWLLWTLGVRNIHRTKNL